MKKLLAFLAIISYLLFAVPTASALSCGDNLPTSEQDLSSYIADCNSKLQDLSGQKQTLTQALSVLNTQIKLTQAKIATTTTQLDKLNAEISDLSTKISSLDYSLTDLTKVFVSRVKTTYMQRGNFDSYVVAQLTGIPDFIRLIEYQKILREHDQNILISLEKSRLDFDQQKTTKEVKQKEIATLKTQLDREKSALSGQISAKNKLLAETNNSEAKYQQLRASAQAQLDAFNTYVSQQGGSSILSGTTKSDPGWGTYYNQREDDWAGKLLPGSSYTMASSGCLVTSMAMVMSYYGKSVTPGNIAEQSELFSFGDFRQGSWKIAGVDTKRERIGYNRTALDNELSANPGKPVIVGIIQYGSSRPEHFFVVKAKDGDDYIINDPFPENGYNAKFTARYPISSIAAVDRVTVN